MGQSQSRNNGTTPETPPEVVTPKKNKRKSLLSLVKRSTSSSANSTPTASPRSSVYTSSTNSSPKSQSRRSTFRKSLLGLVRPSSTIQPEASSSSSRPLPQESLQEEENAEASGSSNISIPRPTTPFPIEPTNSIHETSQNIADWMGGDRRVQTENTEDAVENNNRNIPLQPSISPPPVPESQQPRTQFPPSGTLVLVQGVVHTTDVSNSAPQPDATASTSARNRLSTLIQSRSQSRPTSIADEVAENTDTETIGADHNSDVPTQPSSENNHPAPIISSSSIDILGTLLSVAAAATAASLLSGSGSGENLMSRRSVSTPTPETESNRASSPSSDTDDHDPITTRPSSPTPTAGLDRAERLRNTWGSIRERLGMEGNAAENENNTSSEEAPVQPDTRGMMLSEMARAFNLGLGLDARTSINNSTVFTNSTNSELQIPATESEIEDPLPFADVGSQDEIPTPTRPTSVPPLALPAEGTFERFLMNLQIDLRIALTLDPSLGQDAARNARRPSTDSEPEDSEWTDGDDFNNDQDANTTDDNTPNNQLPLPNGHNVNWWRSFQFPPIVSPRDDTNHSTAPPETQSSTDPTSSPPLLDGVTEPPLSSDSGTSTTNIVFPVILVGLQSVSVGSTTPNPMSTTGPDPLEHPFARQQSGNQMTDDPSGRGRRWQARAANALRNLRPQRNGSNANTTTNNDPNVQNSDAEAAGTAAGGDARTFLIYVIGGYYPPGHSLVTGSQNGQNTFGSFEALLELAELLGQVKPQTATKAEIEKSGLQIFQASELPQHYNDGIISENCIERCLICLDEYAPEENVRVLGCRHGFHKNCVDRWLETGRNNCPACRSKGVPGGNDAAPLP